MRSNRTKSCRSIAHRAGLALLLAFCSIGAQADEIRLKDGTKIIGTIVGFENGSFRVETSYGFALIEKDKVADINITAAKKDLESKAKSNSPPAAITAPVSPDSSVPTATTASVSNTPASDLRISNPSGAATSAGTRDSSPANTASGAKPLASDRPPVAKIDTAPIKVAPKTAIVAVAPAPPAARLAVPAAPTVPPPAPPVAPAPVVIRDEIRGNLYVNLTYGFQMYKPPSWDLIPEARKSLPDAVAALGTSDQTTLLVIGREHAKDSLASHAAATAKALGSVYDNYRLISSRQISVAGSPAIEQRSRGTADGRDWSVTLLTFLRGSDAYTLLGMTWADSDLIQVEENVISKTVNSVTFGTPQQ